MFENSNGRVKEAMPNTEVVAKAKRKRFTATEKPFSPEQRTWWESLPLSVADFPFPVWH